MKLVKIQWAAILAAAVLTACSKDDDGGGDAPQDVQPPAPAPVVQPGENSGSTLPPPSPQPDTIEPIPDTPPPAPVPAIHFTKRPVDPTFSRNAVFMFQTSAFTANGFECSVNGGPFADCSSPLTLPDLTPGQQVLTVRAGSSSGTVSATYAWTVDQGFKAHPVNSHVNFTSVDLIHDIRAKDGSSYISTKQGLFIWKENTALKRYYSGVGFAHDFTYHTLIQGNHLFVANAAGLGVSGDLGATMTNKTTANGLLANYVAWLAFDKTQNRLYVVHNNGLSYTDDLGVTFATKNSFTGIPAGGFLQMFVTDGGRIFLLTTTNRIYTATSLTGTFSEIVGPGSLNVTASRMHVTPAGHVFVATANGGLYISTDSGTTFAQKTTADGLPVNAINAITASADGSVIYAATTTGLGMSFDGGASFSAYDTTPVSGSAYVRRISLGDDGSLYFAEEDGSGSGIFVSRNVADINTRTQSDHTAPVVASASSLAVSNRSENGISFNWQAANDALTPAGELVYQLFQAPSGTDMTSLTSIYLNATLVNNLEGMTTGAFYPGDSNSYAIGVVVRDLAGNKSLYTPLTTSVGSALAAQTWSQQSADTGMGSLEDQRLIKHGTSLYTIGGILPVVPFTVQNKVYSSTDGINWTDNVQSGSVAERFQHGAASFNNKIWIAAGYNASAALMNDVASTTDGVTWDTATASAPFSARSNPALVSFNGKLWLIGGNTSAGMVSDVWFSTDGSNWTKATDNAGFKALGSPRVVVNGSYMYHIGEGNDQEVWRTSDGLIWQRLLATRPLGSSHNFAVVSHSSKIYIIGGSSTQVWTSPDGIVWDEVDTGGTFPGREAHVSASFNNKIWLYQGVNAGFKVDIWAGQ